MNEQLSALIDDELALDEAGHVITALHANQSAAQAWEDYHFIGDTMRCSAMLSADFKHRLMQKIELEPTVLSPNAASIPAVGLPPASLPLSNIKRLPATWAMAASMAGVVMVGWMLWQTQSSQHAPSMQIASPSVPPMQAVQAQQTAEAIPDEYLMAHQAIAPAASSYYFQTASFSK